ncbi:rifin [Plasmodium falciparum IGH-CR14]|uniref:Rifin n=2 Tax=Plasmodium falciparum TaxID=5833 RepID=A0A0L1IFU0_PLAFA|nr:rifin [Plasmodium falciparum IGH-CR14]
MKEVMQQFDRQSSQRFLEYDEHMQEKRRKCKEQCDKDIQKIILKDRIEKELTERLTTLETNIGTNDIPTCVCEKSIADKMEKTCLRCGQNLGGIVPGLGLIGGAALYSINAWETLVTTSAIEFAAKEGIKAGIKGVIEAIMKNPFFTSIWHIKLSNFIKGPNYHTFDGLAEAVTTAISSTGKTCQGNYIDIYQLCEGISTNRDMWISPVVEAGTKASVSKTATVQKAALDTIESTTATCTTAITAAVIAILIIVLIMVIIYLILRYRRKKKMKKKLQYIKLLK